MSEIHVFNHRAMATQFQVRIAGEEKTYAAQAAQAVFAVADALESRLSRFRADSEITQLAQLAPGETQRVSEPVFAVLELAKKMEVATHGAFSAAAAALQSQFAPPQWTLLKAPFAIRCDRGKLEFDLGAIGKGFALDRMAAGLREWSCPAFLLVAGGSSILAGAAPLGTAGWSCGLGDDNSPQRYWLKNASLSGSGLAVRGQHILDPRTGEPAARRNRVWALTETAAESDALSTAAMILSETEIAAVAGGNPRWLVLLQEAGQWRHLGQRPPPPRVESAGDFRLVKPPENRHLTPMSNPDKTTASSVSTSGSLPAYIAGAVPNPPANRAPWYKNTAPTYAGIFLWFVFWQDAVNAPNQGGLLSCGIGWAFTSLVIAALVCHFLFYLVPGLLGMKTGLPLYIVGTSLFGAQGGFILPGFLMGVLQFGWLGVNVYFSSLALAAVIPVKAEILMVIWGVLAAFVGLKGIQYVAKVATYLPLIPLTVLLVLLAKTAGGISSFDPEKFVALSATAAPAAPAALGKFGVLALMLTFVVGFFATAGAAGVDFGTNSRNKSDVSKGGLVGVALAIIVTAGISMLIVAGTYGTPALSQAAVAAGKDGLILQTPGLIPVLMGKSAGLIMFLLAIAAFPPACFSSFIAANSFKTTLPGVNPFISVGIGAAVSILLAVTGLAGKAIIVFVIIGATFGPICGAMLVEYLLNGGKWSGPRAGFNPAGWIAWLVGAVVGVLPILKIYPVPAAPVAAFIVGAVVYFLCAKVNLLSAILPLPAKK